jgi:hypothetical protein
MSSRSLSENKVKICKTIFFLIVLYGFETWSLISRKKHRVSQNRVLRVIFGTKGTEIIGGWTRLHNKEIYNLYLTPNIIIMIKSGGCDGQGM